jgi:hypothetical protein
MPKPCCGQRSRPRRLRPADDEALPSNPKIPGGKSMLYLGWGRRNLKGKVTGKTYYVSNSRRKFTVDAADVPSIRSREVIEKPTRS